MYLSISDELQLFAEELYEHLTPSFLENLARELGFVKRKRKFSGCDLDQMDQRGVYYISRLKLNNRVYVKMNFTRIFEKHYCEFLSRKLQF